MIGMTWVIMPLTCGNITDHGDTGSDTKPSSRVGQAQASAPNDLAVTAGRVLALASAPHHTAAGTLASLFHTTARTGTIRRQLITLPARITRRSRRITLRLPTT